jgi:L-ascorbate metabolism protein UlaG (beta-lactamase superfamily)
MKPKTVRSVSDHFDGSRFFNPTGGHLKNIWDLIKWQASGNRTPWPEKIEIPTPPPLLNITDENAVVATYLNHATVLIQTRDFNILTDPIWSSRTSPVQWAGPKRIYAPPIPFDSLPRIDLVLLSHNHYDHMDANTLGRLYQKFKPRFLIPLGDQSAMQSFGIPHSHEMDWWDEIVINPDLKIIFTPSQHWSARGVRDKNKSLWGSFLMIYRGQKIYFAGDTGYSVHFKNLYEKYGKMDISLLPIGAYEPRWFMKDHHMNPEEAVQAHLDLGSRRSMAIHFGTFQLTDEGYDKPVQDLKKALAEKNIPQEDFQVLSPGHRILAP